MKSIFPEKFIARIFIGLATLLLLTIIVSDASPINALTSTPAKSTSATSTSTKSTSATSTPAKSTPTKSTPATSTPETSTPATSNPANSTSANSTSGAPPTPASEDDVQQFLIWVKYASAAYCNVTGWDCGVACSGVTNGTRLVKFFSNVGPRDNNGYVAISDSQKAIIVGYRGSANVQSFVSDVQFIQTPSPFNNAKFPNAKVHSGFLATYNDTREEITNLVKSLVKQNPDYKVVSTGHSLGGALAVFQTLDLIGTPGLNPSNLITYTYGEPRTGNKDFSDLVQSTGFKFFRVVNKNDLVPHLPPQDFEYDHFGPEFWVDPKNNIVECATAEDINCSNSQTKDLSIIAHADYFNTAFVLTCLAK